MKMYSTEYIVKITSKLCKRIYEEKPDKIGIAFNNEGIVIYGYKDNFFVKLI